MSVEQLVIAARDIGAKDPFIAACELAVEAERLRRFLADLANTKVFPATIRGVEKIRAENGLPGKCRVTLSTADRTGKPEVIDTDWLTDPIALYLARRAHAARECPVLVWKANDEDATGTVSQGYRRLVWLTFLPDEAKR